MKYLLILAASLFTLPAVAVESRDHCSLRDLDGSWVYYSFAPSDNYAMTCSLQISSGTINRGIITLTKHPLDFVYAHGAELRR